MWGIFRTMEQKEEAERRIKQKEDAIKAAEIEKQQVSELKENYIAERKAYGFKQGGCIVTLRNRKWHIFVSADHLKMFICIPNDFDLLGVKKVNWQRQSIALKNIQYFLREGSIYSETKVFGGGTKPINIVDVAVGGVIAGTTGAIIAARPQQESIKSETIRHDERKTILVYNKGKLEFAPEDYNVLMKLIPDKEFSVVQQKRATQKSEQSKYSTNKEDPVEVLRKLKVMLDEGLIEQYEYDKKKEEVLKRM